MDSQTVRWFSGQATPAEIKQAIAINSAVKSAVEAVGLDAIKRGPFFGVGDKEQG